MTEWLKKGIWFIIFWRKTRLLAVRQAPYSPNIIGYRQKKSESSALLQSFPHFPYNENSTKALNTTSLKVCLPLTGTNERREKFMYAFDGWRSPRARALHWNPPSFDKTKKRRVLKTTWQKWKHFEEMFVRTLHYHELNSSSCLQTIMYRKFCKNNQIYSE